VLVLFLAGAAAVSVPQALAHTDRHSARAQAAAIIRTAPFCPIYHLTGNLRRGFTCESATGHHHHKPRCDYLGGVGPRVADRSGKRFWCQFDTAPPAFVGSISSFHVVTGYTVGATFTISSKNCTGKASCVWYAHAFQVAGSQTCNFGNGVQRWIFTGQYQGHDLTDTHTANFIEADAGSVKICLFVHGSIDENRYTTNRPVRNEPGRNVVREYLVAEAIIQTSSSGPRVVPRTPLTVNNICSFNPGLGVHYPFKGPKGPGVYWDNDKNGVVDFAAFSYEGDNAVDAVFVNNSNGVLTWVAHCYPHETPWMSYAQIAKAQSQPQAQPQQPQPPQQLQQAPPPLAGNAGMQLLDVLDAGSKGSNLYSPLPSYEPVGTLEPNTTPGCDVNSGGCITERPPDPTVL
jgi:hypothetical protein